jgi:hypothetical protein
VRTWLAAAAVLGGLLWAAAAGAAGPGTQDAIPVPAIDASHGQPGQLATYPGPGGVPVPVGACGAVIGGKVWVLPCDAPEVRAYRQAQAAAQAARQRRHFWTTAAVGTAGDLVLAGTIGILAWADRARAAREGRMGWP